MIAVALLMFACISCNKTSTEYPINVSSRISLYPDSTYMFAVHKYSVYSADDALYLLGDQDRKAIIKALAEHWYQAEPYNANKVYGISNSTTGPYSVPPPMETISIYKEKASLTESPDANIYILTQEYLTIDNIMINNKYLVQQINSIIKIRRAS